MTKGIRSDKQQVNGKPDCRERAVAEFTDNSISAGEDVRYVDWMVTTRVV